MSEINIELDGKKTWPGLEYTPGELTGIALQTNEALANGDGVPSLTLRVEVPVDGEEPVTILTEVKVATIIMVLAAVKGRLQHLEDIRAMVTSLGGKG